MRNIVLAIGLGALALTPVSLVAQGGGGSVTGAATGSFDSDAVLASIPVTAVELGTGVLIDPDGTAVGSLHAVLRGTVWGQPQLLTLEGKIRRGAVNADGLASFSGTATLDLGDGTPSLPVSWLNVEVSANGLVLTVDSVTLAASLASGSVIVE